jgi:hypothetical protein
MGREDRKDGGALRRFHEARGLARAPAALIAATGLDGIPAPLLNHQLCTAQILSKNSGFSIRSELGKDRKQ